jgi:hypothetical protein
MRSNCVMAASFWRLMLNCVCMYVCMYISNTRKFLAFDAQLCVCVYVCMCVCMHVCMYACMYAPWHSGRQLFQRPFDVCILLLISVLTRYDTLAAVSAPF